MIVKNVEELLDGYKGTEREIRKMAIEIVEHVIKRSNPEKLVLDFLNIENGKNRKAKLKTGEILEFDRAYVVAIGKAAYPMAKAITKIIPDVSGVIVTKYGYAESKKLGNLEVIEAGHPVPDENSVIGVKKALKILEKAKKDDLLILLISGGGSSLFAMPEDGITLEDKIKTYKLLLECGARIQEINTVRKHISAIKGGKFVKKATCRVLSLIISDVVGDDLETIASGISVKDSTTFEDAISILKSYKIWDKVPNSVKEYLERGRDGKEEETLKEDLNNVINKLICGSSKVCEFAVEKARDFGVNTYILTSQMEGESKDVGIFLASIAIDVKNKNRPFNPPAVIVAGGETTVTLMNTENSKGGPNQELALGFAKKLDGCKSICLISIDTDGTDGPTDAAGGLVSYDTWNRIREAGLNPMEELIKHNSYKALKSAKALVFTGPTETNVNSITILVIR